MAPPYQDSSPPSFPSDHEADHHFSDHLFFPTTPQASSSSSSSLSFPIFPHDTAQDHGAFFNSSDSQQLQLKREGGVIVPCDIGSCDIDQTVGNDHPETGLRFTIWKQIDKSESSSCDNNGLVKWASSKMRLVVNSNQTETTATEVIDGSRNFQDRNQTSPSDQTHKRRFNSLNDGGNAIIRTCSDCNTTKTPLWRSGPRGPKSLCNACGIRQRKARRAMAAAAEAAANGGIPCGGKPTAVLKANKVQQKAIKRAAGMNGNLPQTLMKRSKCKDAAATAAAVAVAAQSRGRKKLCFEDIAIGGGSSESSSGYQRVFPQDEREAAILLMTLSYGYGLLHG